MMRKIRAKVAAYYNGEINKESFNQTLQSYLGVLKYCRSRNIKEKFFIHTAKLPPAPSLTLAEPEELRR